MSRRTFAWFLVMILMLSAAVYPAGAEEELDIEELIEVEEPEETPGIYETDGSTVITVTCTGDFTIGGDNYHNKSKFFYKRLKEHDGDINFVMANTRNIFLNDDLTLVNFEGTLTETKKVPDNKKKNKFLFNIAPEYVTVLSDNGVEAVSLENNHVMDHGEEAYEETKETLRSAGIVYSNSEEIGIFEVSGIQIAMLSYLCIDRYDKPIGQYANLYEKVEADIKAVKKQYPIVIVSFHWGNELDYSPTERQIKMGRLAADSGADLVIGHHSHRINPIEEYNGVYICYSLGNFCFSGNEAPSDMTSFIFQTRFKITKSGDVSNTGFRVIPIRITSIRDKNDCIPTPVEDERLQTDIINVMKDNGRKLDYAVADYPLEWR
ncbi:MAG: CapA family protein [Clostridia bacterium]|nr:CapA family protein [Clostridia bacterium]